MNVNVRKILESNPTRYQRLLSDHVELSAIQQAVDEVICARRVLESANKRVYLLTSAGSPGLAARSEILEALGI